MKLRVYDEAYLGHVDRFWNALLPRMAPYLYHRGGPILMTQVGAAVKTCLRLPLCPSPHRWTCMATQACSLAAISCSSSYALCHSLVTGAWSSCREPDNELRSRTSAPNPSLDNKAALHGNPFNAVAGQIENEYGFCGFNDKAYLQHLADTARASLGAEAVLFTTDPPNAVTMGGLYGDDVISCAPRALCLTPARPRPHWWPSRTIAPNLELLMWVWYCAHVR